MIVCMTCARPVEFGPEGWVHRDPNAPCEAVSVAWPPADTLTDDDSETAA
jgi:hypothetical protein